jgi:hypothetical protein
MSIRRIFGVWFALCAAMIANGIFREVALVPAFRRTVAEVLSAALGIGIVLSVTRCFLRGRAGKPGAHPARVALLWLSVTVAFEFLFGHYVDRKSWGELAANYALWRGKLWPLVLLSVGFTPFLWLRQQHQREDGAEPSAPSSYPHALAR